MSLWGFDCFQFEIIHIPKRHFANGEFAPLHKQVPSQTIDFKGCQGLGGRSRWHKLEKTAALMRLGSQMAPSRIGPWNFISVWFLAWNLGKGVILTMWFAMIPKHHQERKNVYTGVFLVGKWFYVSCMSDLCEYSLNLCGFHFTDFRFFYISLLIINLAP